MGICEPGVDRPAPCPRSQDQRWESLPPCGSKEGDRQGISRMDPECGGPLIVYRTVGNQ